MPTDPTDTAGSADQDRITGSAAVESLLRPHRYDCDCAPCVELRTNLAAITEAEAEAWRTSRDIFIR